MAIIDRAVYPTQQIPLQHQVEELLKATTVQPIDGEILGIIVPDTNLLSGGTVAAEVYARLKGKHIETVIIVSPSHAGPFPRVNICNLDDYRSPLGPVPINDLMRNELCDEDDDIYVDNRGHFHTEGVDVQLPFLQTVLNGFDIVPVVMGEETPEYCRELGQAIGEVMYNRRTLVVACADILSASEESLALLKEYIERQDISRLMSLLNSETVLMEGKGAVLVALIAAIHRRANRAEVTKIQPPIDTLPGFMGAVLWRE